MVVLRGTQKLLKALQATAAPSDTSDTALGDWYVNRVVIDRQPLLLCVAANSLLSVIAPARNVKHLPLYFPELVAKRLCRLGVKRNAIDAELAAMQPVCVGKTQDRSIVGTMVDFAKVLPYHLPAIGWDLEDLMLAEDKLAETPCRCGQAQATIWPGRDTMKLLETRWLSVDGMHGHDK
jgi:hypothetical protein